MISLFAINFHKIHFKTQNVTTCWNNCRPNVFAMVLEFPGLGLPLKWVVHCYKTYRCTCVLYHYNYNMKLANPSFLGPLQWKIVQPEWDQKQQFLEKWDLNAYDRDTGSTDLFHMLRYNSGWAWHKICKKWHCTSAERQQNVKWRRIVSAVRRQVSGTYGSYLSIRIISIKTRQQNMF